VFKGLDGLLEVLDLAGADVVPSGTRRNHAYLQPFVDWGELTEPEQLVLADAQTSGGLLIAATDPEGRYRIDDVPTGTYTLAAWNDGEVRETRPVRVPEGGTVELDFVLR